MTVQYVRAADRIAGHEEPRSLDLAPLQADWRSATALPGGVSRILTSQRDGTLLVRAYGEGEPRPGDWGETGADSVYANALASRDARAFLVTFEGEHVRSHAQTYCVLGLLTTHTFHHFTDGSGRRDFFTREFFVGATPSEAAGSGLGAGGAGMPAALASGRNDPSGLLGTWTCLDPVVGSLLTLECGLAGGELTVRTRAAGTDGPIDWGVVPTQVFADGTYPDMPPAFLATYDHGFMRMHLQARINRGVLVVIEYAEFTDGSGRPNYYIRECFRRS